MTMTGNAKTAALFEARRVPGPYAAGVVILHSLFTVLVNLVYFQYDYDLPLARLTNGWISGTLSGSLIGVVLEVIVYLLLIVKVPAQDLGLKASKLVPGLLGALLFWLSIQAANFGLNVLSGKSIPFNEDLAEYPSYFISSLLGQLFGNAFLEEVVFRGFLFIQIFLLLRVIKWHSLRVATAMLISQIAFALIHIPNRIYSVYAGMEFVYDFIIIVISGCIFCLLYLLTENLFVVIGIHSFYNERMMLWLGDYSDIIFYAGVLVLLVVLSGIKLWRRRSHRIAIQL